MNERKERSRRRKADIERLQTMIKTERITDLFLHIIKESKDNHKISAVKNLAQYLSGDLQSQKFDLEEFYELIKKVKNIFSPSEYLRIIFEAEDFARDAIDIQKDTSWERQYIAECEAIKEAGYLEDQLYMLSYPDRPDIEPVKWLVTEFGVYGNGIPQPVRGCRMKKDGNPSRKVEYISIPRDDKFLLEKCEY